MIPLCRLYPGHSGCKRNGDMMFDAFWFIFSIVYGMILGSFTNVCIFRIPEKKSLWHPPSTCGNCGYRLKWYDNVPLISFIVLRGKCRQCHSHISWQYPAVEVLCGILMALMFLRIGLMPDLIFLSAAMVVLVTISVIDYKTMIIPNGTVIALLVIGFLYTLGRLIFPGAFFTSITWLEALIGFFAASVPLYLIAVISKGGMGGGDVKLMAAAGLFLGWKNIIVAMIIGSVIGAIVSLTLIAMKRKKRKDMIPFGPFLCLGILIAAVVGRDIVAWYIGLFTF